MSITRAVAVASVVLSAASGIAASGCHARPRPLVDPDPVHAEDVRTDAARAAGEGAGGPSTPAALEPPSPPPPARVERVRVPGDLPVSVVRAPDGTPPRIVFLPGICSSVLGYVQAIQGAAQAHGGVVGVDGDVPCPGNPSFHSFARDIPKLHARIEAALAASGVTDIPRDGLVLVGYSQGAALGEQLVARYPDRYARVVLIGAPSEPEPSSFAKARAVVTMSCDRDVPWKMKEAARRIERAKVPATYVEMPSCTHGMIGDGERVFREAFAWIAENARAPRPSATATRITGPLDEG